MFNRSLFSVSVAFLSVASVACGGSSTSGATSSDGGSHPTADAGAADGGQLSDGGSSVADATGPVDAGVCLPTATTYTPHTFKSATSYQAVCAPSDISGFVAACGLVAQRAITQGGADTCTPWLTTNLSGKCGSCLVNADNTGAEEVSLASGEAVSDWKNGWVSANNWACTQILGGGGGAACSQAGLADDDCTIQACNIPCAQTQAGGGQCQNASTGTGGVCATIDSTYNTACASYIQNGNLALPAACYPSAATRAAADTNLAFIANLICGTVPPPDAGAPPVDGGAATDAAIPVDAAAVTDAASAG